MADFDPENSSAIHKLFGRFLFALLASKPLVAV